MNNTNELNILLVIATFIVLIPVFYKKIYTNK